MASDTFQSITIEGFKSIRALKVDLRPINILIGANGSGKSNFLEAFVFLKECLEGRKDEYVERNGGADKVLYFGSKTTQKLNLNIFSSNCTSTGAYLEFYMDDKLIGSLPGATTEGGFVGAKNPSF